MLIPERFEKLKIFLNHSKKFIAHRLIWNLQTQIKSILKFAIILRQILEIFLPYLNRQHMAESKKYLLVLIRLLEFPDRIFNQDM